MPALSTRRTLCRVDGRFNSTTSALSARRTLYQHDGRFISTTDALASQQLYIFFFIKKRSKKSRIQLSQNVVGLRVSKKQQIKQRHSVFPVKSVQLIMQRSAAIISQKRRDNNNNSKYISL